MTTEQLPASAQTPAKRPSLDELLEKLTDKQRVFADEYLKHYNGTEAAITAFGPAASRGASGVKAYNTLKKVQVRQYIDAMQRMSTYRARVSRARIEDELVNLAFANLQDFIKVTDAGDAYLDLSEMTREQASAIAELTSEEYLDGRGDGARSVKRTKIKLSEKTKALHLLAKMRGYVDQPAALLNGLPANTKVTITFESVPLPDKSESVNGDYRILPD